VLEIEYRGDGVYQYEDVEADTYNALMEAPSKGRYFAERIRDHYSWRRVEEG
jgi:KTSC domain